MSTDASKSVVPSAGQATTTTTSGRRNRNRKKGARKEEVSQTPRKSGFKGTTAEMNGHVFECYDEQQDRRQYTKTVEELQAYVKKHLDYSEDLANLFLDEMKEPSINEPPDPTANNAKASKLQEMVYVEQVKGYVKRLTKLSSNLATLHAVIWGQCSESMRAKVKALNEYKAKTEANDCFWNVGQHGGVLKNRYR
jgi:hypothetical protein